MIAAHIVWDHRFTAYDFGRGHPMHPMRLQLTHTLSQALGLLDHEEVTVGPARPAETDLLGQIHSGALIEEVRRLSADPGAADGRFGIGSSDTPAFSGMHEASALAVGATVEAARQVWSGQVPHAVNIAGGLHHAMPGRASGFCVYNDVAAGILDLLAHGAERVAYLDLDVHHGDGVETIFWNDPRVLTVSLHETGRMLFPGTGFAGDTGGPGAPDSAVNVALPPETDDRGWLRAFAAVVPALLGAFSPDVIVSQHGCDSHRDDPLAHLSLTIDGMRTAQEWVHELAHRECEGRWVALGGGGYELVQVVPRAWSHLVGLAGHRPVGLDAAIPSEWQQMVRRVCGVNAPATMGDRGGAAIEYGAWEEGYNPDDPVDSSVMATRRAVFPGWGLDPFFD
ncbi:MAG TPA: acetoin utilization protein AcuC [Ornithinimicrobium sp.]|uniref:acetoin utilization protein AcuC n=1 Tax=Ornithinimicrobium sp. TaxID=1977084 RepID=UPI002B48958F|nr:acetoin utilization protein AcuC [Ornithinimicrobium sp.]HKJ12084.1 acetoin utilization protein AcuC [Ornithinimicrobium sp.]